MRCNNSKVSGQIGSQGVLLLIQDKQLMEQIIYKLCNCKKTMLTHNSGGRITHLLKCWNLVKQTASLSTCYLGLCLG